MFEFILQDTVVMDAVDEMRGADDGLEKIGFISCTAVSRKREDIPIPFLKVSLGGFDIFLSTKIYIISTS
jgi:hypothetical protein